MLLSSHGRRIYYDLAGPEDAETVYLAHPLAADSGMWMDQVSALLRAGYRVLRVDMRGHGGSDPAPGNYRMEQLVADAVLVLDQVQVERAHFCGLSIGGMIALGVAILHAERVASMVLSDTRAASPADALDRWGPRITEVQAQNSTLPLAADTMMRWLSPECRRRRPQLWQQIHDTVAATSPQGYIGCAAAIQNFSWVDRLSQITAATLVLCGADDLGSDLDENQDIARRVQRGEFRIIEDARHLPNVEHPQLFNQILFEWLGAHPANELSRMENIL